MLDRTKVLSKSQNLKYGSIRSLNHNVPSLAKMHFSIMRQSFWQSNFFFVTFHRTALSEVSEKNGLKPFLMEHSYFHETKFSKEVYPIITKPYYFIGCVKKEVYKN